MGTNGLALLTRQRKENTSLFMGIICLGLNGVLESPMDVAEVFRQFSSDLNSDA